MDQEMTTHVNRQWRIARRPVGMVKESDFAWQEAPVPTPGPGQLLVRNEYLSVDPASRAWMWHDDTAFPAQPLGSVMRGITVGTVVQSRNSMFPEGSSVLGVLGWQDYTLTDGQSDSVMRLPDADEVPPTMQLGLLGHVGITAYFGLLDVGRPTAGETLVVSSAAGAVGSLVGQIGKLYGCRVIGIAGTAEKCRWLREELGFDAAIDYKSEPVFKRLKQHCPHGIDIYFDNVGGPLLEDALNLLNQHARVVACGMLSLYNDVGGMLTFPAGPNNLLNLTLRRARMEGFVCLDFWPRAPEALDALVRWHREGRLRYRVAVVEGLRQAPRALKRLFEGSNRGKLVVKLS
jgi:hypothetical protein